MAVYKEPKTNTWRVIYRYTDWNGERKQSQKRGFQTKREAQSWEREQLNKLGSDLDMTFRSFVDNNPDVKVKTAMNWASQVWPFAHEMKKGEIVVLPSKIKPVIHFGKIMGDYEFLPNNDNPYYHAHQVDWFACDIPRTAFDQDILYSFGAFMTICRIKQEDRIKAVINAHKQGKKAPQITPQEPQDDEEARDIENEALGVITNGE